MPINTATNTPTHTTTPSSTPTYAIQPSPTATLISPTPEPKVRVFLPMIVTDGNGLNAKEAGEQPLMRSQWIADLFSAIRGLFE